MAEELQDIEVSFEIKKPVTYRMFEDACRIVGVAVDDMLEDPKKALEGKTLPVSKANQFFETVLVSPPEGVEDMPIEQVEAVGAYAVAAFFLRTSLALYKARMRGTKKWAEGRASRRRPAVL